MTRIFVFGSNLAGRHGAGAALHARKYYGASYGVGEGRTGMAYAIPTKNQSLQTLPIGEIRKSVDKFLSYARTNWNLSFQVTPIGCGLAGYEPGDIAPLFRNAPANVELPESFKKVLEEMR